MVGMIWMLGWGINSRKGQEIRPEKGSKFRDSGGAR